MKRLHTVVAGALVLTACGGGGGGGIGGGGHVARPPAPIAAALRQKTDNPSAATVARYIQETAQGPVDPNSFGLGRFDAPPTVRLLRGATARERAMLHHAVGMINRHLPYNWHVKVGSDLSQARTDAIVSAIRESTRETRQILSHVPDGEVAIYFTGEPLRAADGRIVLGLAALNFNSRYDPVQRRWERQSLRASGAWVARHVEAGEDWKFTVLLHEILHALGLYDHPDPDRFPTSILAATRRAVKSLPDIDGTALRVAYTRLPNGAEPEDIDAGSLGEWATVSDELAGTMPTAGGTVRFGLNYTNGFVVPWTSGPAPGRGLADNRSLAGTATWNGKLYGATVGRRGLGGDARVTVDMGTLAGRADFTNLQSWPEAQVRAGTAFAATPGVQWKTGSLGYTIAVYGNYLRSTGGDDGTITGQFYGRAHQGVAGSLERPDLTAVFGARR